MPHLHCSGLSFDRLCTGLEKVPLLAQEAVGDLARRMVAISLAICTFSRTTPERLERIVIVAPSHEENVEERKVVLL